MKVVREFIKVIKTVLPLASLGLCLSLTFLASCNPTEIKGKIQKSGVVVNDGTFDNKAYIYRDSPYIIAGPKYPIKDPDMGSIIDAKNPEIITLNTQLTSNCTMNFLFGASQSEIASCIRIISSKENTTSLPRHADRSWVFAPNSPEFYQVNTLYHINVGLSSFFKKLEFAYDRVNTLSTRIPRSIPPYLKTSQMFWFKGITDNDNKLLRNSYLNTIAQCDFEGNAQFTPAGPELCFGGFTPINLWLVQDPSIIYHELGHALVSVMMNIRNGTSTSAHVLRSNLANFGYDEAGAINEGIADYFSFINNKRTHFAEWAAGKTSRQSRPMTESDPMHIDGIDVTSEGRLSYPQYLQYDPNSPNSLNEDVHYAGQIVSHYLVALTEEFKNKCTPVPTAPEAHEDATAYVVMLLAETLSEVGDLNARGIDNYTTGDAFTSSIYFTNLDPVSSYLWSHAINRPTYRSVFQIFAKNINKLITGTMATGPGLCPSFTKNDSEKLLDDYGLLLFKSYNDNGNSTKSRSLTYSHVPGSVIPLQPLTAVTENNRRKSVLISKELIKLTERTDTAPNVAPYYTIDGRTEMEALLKNLLFKGYSIPLSTNVASVDYNNGNIKISPGEIVAVIPNLYNSSNSTMAGAQILATDWDHVDVTNVDTGNFKPCLVDTITTTAEGAVSDSTCAVANGYPSKDYKRLVMDPVTRKFPTDAVAPVCMALLEEGDSTRWVSQNEFRKKQGLSLQDKDCLGFSNNGTDDPDFTFNPHECLVRFIPGATQAFYSSISPQKNYFDSVVKDSDTKVFNSGNILIMEVNKWIPPGTKFRCRLRARFTNCSDCYHDTAFQNDDFMDAEYNGHKPFKVINFDFDVND